MIRRGILKLSPRWLLLSNVLPSVSFVSRRGDRFVHGLASKLKLGLSLPSSAFFARGTSIHVRAMANSLSNSDRHRRSIRARAGTVAETAEHGDKLYFQSYSHLGIHEEMLRDKVRTDAYRDAIQFHSGFIKDKVVLDVGCGTGILSIFAARAGARKVYAIDASDIATQAKEVVKANGFADIITVMHGKVEEVEIHEKVDVVVSEWMGYMLLYESMLDSVIYARDKWLKPGGLMLPSHATLFMAPITCRERYGETTNFWKDVYGVDMSAMIPAAKKCSFGDPCIENVTGENVLSWPAVVKTIDCGTVGIDELLHVKADFSVTSMMMEDLHGFALWFDVSFQAASLSPTPVPEAPPSAANGTPAVDQGNTGAALYVNSRKKRQRSSDKKADIVLTTAPEEEATHWVQTVLYVDEPVSVEQDQAISGSVHITRSTENLRFLDIQLEYRTGDVAASKTFQMR